MVRDVKEILNNSIEEVLQNAKLSMLLLRTYSILFLNGGQPRACAASQKKYYQQIKIEGMAKAEKYKKVERRTLVLRNSNAAGRMYIAPLMLQTTGAMLDDEIAIKALFKKGLKEDFFKKLPIGYEEGKALNSKDVNQKIAKAIDVNKAYNLELDAEEVEEKED